MTTIMEERESGILGDLETSGLGTRGAGRRQNNSKVKREGEVDQPHFHVMHSL